MQNEMDCKVARDLMPLHLEGLLSDESEEFLARHLDSCEKCRAELNRIKDNIENGIIEEKKKENRFVKAVKRYRHVLIGLIIGIVLAVLLIIGGFVALGHQISKATGVEASTLTDPKDYRTADYRGIAKLMLFPDKAEVSDNIKEYYYDCGGGDMYQIYIIRLNCKYTAEEFAREKERLLSVKDKKQAVYDEEEFSLPAVCAMMYGDGFEYAVLNEGACEIDYIYLQGADRRNIPFDKKLIPKDYGQHGWNFENEREPFSIYE
ncbi:MAG: zf-HC2 domain-containing protein [Lachnospiraceae bacterium]|nr:zf-HC2 domain-containing protein [Lachnospiraceae bacterium]